MIKNLIYDFGNVLVNHDLQPLLTQCFGGEEAEMERFRAIWGERAFVDRCDTGLETMEEIIADLSQQYPDLARAFQFFGSNLINEITGEMEGMRPLLARLKARGYKFYGLSNWGSTVYKVMERFPIFRLLDGRVISCEEHIVKPHPDIYRRLLTRYALRPEQCLFADDRQPNIDGARRVGMEAVLFTTTADYERDLQQRGLCI